MGSAWPRRLRQVSQLGEGAGITSRRRRVRNPHLLPVGVGGVQGLVPVEPNPYDRPDLLDLRKGQDDPILLYYVVRKSVPMTPGKLAPQIGHATGMLSGRYHQLVYEAENLSEEDAQKVRITREWLQTSYRKVTLVADDKEWEKLKAELWCFVVKDAGLTEVDPGTETVMALWPMRKSEAPKLVKRLQTLKGDPIFGVKPPPSGVQG